MIISMNYPKILFSSLLLSSLFTACNNAPKDQASAPGADSTAVMKEENITFTADSASLNAYVVYNDSIKGKKPAVLVLPEWWGLNDYPKMRARQLADLGYVAIALDLYGNGKVADNPDSAK